MEKFVGLPSAAVSFLGYVGSAIATGVQTLSIAAVLVAVPHVAVATHLKCHPLSAGDGVMAHDAPVAPGIEDQVVSGAPFLFRCHHW